MEYVRYEQLDNACKRQERKNLKAEHKSLTWCSMSGNTSRQFCVEVRDDVKILVMKDGWRKFVKTL